MVTPHGVGPTSPLTPQSAADITQKSDLKTLNQPGSEATPEQIEIASKELTDAIEKRVGSSYQFDTFAYIGKQMSEGISGIRIGMNEAKKEVFKNLYTQVHRDQSPIARAAARGVGKAAYGLGVGLYAIAGIGNIAARIVASIGLYAAAGAATLTFGILGTLVGGLVGELKSKEDVENLWVNIFKGSTFVAGVTVEAIMKVTYLVRGPILALTTLGFGLELFGRGSSTQDEAEKKALDKSEKTFLERRQAPLKFIQKHLVDSLKQEGTDILKFTPLSKLKREKQTEAESRDAPSKIDGRKESDSYNDEV